MKELTFENVLAVLKEQGWIVSQIQQITLNYDGREALKAKPTGYQATIHEALPPAPPEEKRAAVRGKGKK